MKLQTIHQQAVRQITVLQTILQLQQRAVQQPAKQNQHRISK